MNLTGNESRADIGNQIKIFYETKDKFHAIFSDDFFRVPDFNVFHRYICNDNNSITIVCILAYGHLFPVTDERFKNHVFHNLQLQTSEINAIRYCLFCTYNFISDNCFGR